MQGEAQNLKKKTPPKKENPKIKPILGEGHTLIGGTFESTGWKENAWIER